MSVDLKCMYSWIDLKVRYLLLHQRSCLWLNVPVLGDLMLHLKELSLLVPATVVVVVASVVQTLWVVCQRAIHGARVILSFFWIFNIHIRPAKLKVFSCDWLNEWSRCLVNLFLRKNDYSKRKGKQKKNGQIVCYSTHKQRRHIYKKKNNSIDTLGILAIC